MMIFFVKKHRIFCPKMPFGWIDKANFDLSKINLIKNWV